MEITVFHNTEAGEGEWPRERILALCQEANLKPTYLDAREADALERLANAIGLVAVVGGDGTVSKALPRLHGSAATLLIVPIGGANNIARSLGVYAEPATVLRRAGGTETADLHVGQLDCGGTRSQFVEFVGLGVLVSLVSAPGQSADRESKREAGRARLMDALSEARPLRARILIDGTVLDETILAFEAMNIAMIGPNLPLAPRAARSSGQMIACWLREEHRAVMHQWLQGPSQENSPMQAVAAERIEIDLVDHSLRIDDALSEYEGNIRMQLDRRPIKVMVPRGLP